MGAALAAYREAVRRAPGFADARKTLADALAQMGEHEQAIAELDGLLRLERSNEQAAKNREILAHALEEMRRARLLGKTAREVEASALVERGGLVEKGQKPREGGGSTVRYRSPLVELDVDHAPGGEVVALTLVLPSPERAARAEDDLFRVTVVDEAGHPKPTDLGTAATLTFLREALGCPMTQAAALYTRLLSGGEATDSDLRGGASRSRSRRVEAEASLTPGLEVAKRAPPRDSRSRSEPHLGTGESMSS